MSQEIQQVAKVLAILDSESVQDKILSALLPIYGNDIEKVKPIAVAEALEYKRVLSLLKAEDLIKIPAAEIQRVAISAAATGLSWAQEERNFWVMPQYVGGKMCLDWQVSPYGETTMRIKQGIIKRLSGPFIIYEGDKVTNINYSKATIDHEPAFPPNPKAKVIGVYSFIILPDGTKELRLLHQVNFDRLANASRKKNTPRDATKVVAGKEYANALYFSHNGGIDPGFAEAKCIKHGYKGLPKCKRFGAFANVKFATEMDDEEEEVQTQEQGYAREAEEHEEVTHPDENQNVEVMKADEDEF